MTCTGMLLTYTYYDIRSSALTSLRNLRYAEGPPPPKKFGAGVVHKFRRLTSASSQLLLGALLGCPAASSPDWVVHAVSRKPSGLLNGPSGSFQLPLEAQGLPRGPSGSSWLPAASRSSSGLARTLLGRPCCLSEPFWAAQRPLRVVPTSSPSPGVLPGSPSTLSSNKQQVNQTHPFYG